MSFDLLLPCSAYCRERSISYWSLDAERVALSYPGVDTVQFAPNPRAGEREREQLGLHPASTVLLYIGRVCSQKGTDTLLAAYNELRLLRPETALVIAGPIEQFAGTSPELVRSWETRIRDSGALYLGGVDEARLVGLFNMANVFVMPTYELEMFGMAASAKSQATRAAVMAAR